MANSTITLYTREIGIEAEKLQMIEDFETYLQSKATSLAIVETYQYQKIELNKYLKVDISQSYQSPLKDKNYIYCKIVNSDNTTRPLYYWIKKMNWKSQSCIELELVLDTLNTFKMGTDYTFSPRTIIQRQHKDRMKATTIGELLDLRNTTIDDQYNPIIRGTYYRIPTQLVLEEWFTHEFLMVDSNDEQMMFSMSIFKADGTPVVFKKNVGLVEFVEMYGNYRVKTFRLEYWEGGSKEITIAENDNSYIFLFAIYDNMTGNFIDGDEDLTDQFKYQIFQYNNADGTFLFTRIVDLMGEELQPQLYSKYEAIKIEDTESQEESWYLVYDTVNEGDTAVKCYLMPENDTEIITSGSAQAKTITPSMVGGDIVLISLSTYDKDDFELANGSSLPTYANLSGSFLLDGAEKFLQLRVQQGVIIGSVLTWGEFVQGGETIRGYLSSPSFATPYLNYVGNSSTIVYGRTSTNYDYHIYEDFTITEGMATGYTWGGGGTITMLSGIASLNRTRSTLIKIIKIPYLPYNFNTGSGGRLVLDTNYFELDTLGSATTLRIKNNVLEYSKNLHTDLDSPIYTDMVIDITSQVINENRNDNNEAKIYHSEFYTPKFTYDSFGFVFRYELLDMDSYLTYIEGDSKLDITFHMTTTINSKMGFKFNDYILNNREEDIYNWLLIARNNEEVIYNSAYLNYIRTGYNYDVKNKETQNTRNWISAGASIVATLGSLALTIASGGSAMPLAIATIGGVVASVTTLTNAITSQTQNERALQQKLDTLKIQSASISGSDDVDLMTRYCGNRLLCFTYSPSERIDKLLKDLFYYYGYKDNVSGVPSTNTRIWFNYLKCEPILEFTSLNMTNEIEDELKGIMRNGFTICHKYNGTWNIEQDKENWEVSMLPYL